MRHTYSYLPRLRLDQFYRQNGKKLVMLEASIMSISSRKKIWAELREISNIIYALNSCGKVQ